MFWMMLGNDEYANADLWKYKDQLDRVGTRLFSVDSTKRKTPVSDYFYCLRMEALTML